MRAFPDVRMREVLSMGSRAQRLLDEGEFSNAREAFLEARAQVSSMGLPASGHLAWGLCVALDNLGEYETAMAASIEALNLDPLSPSYQRSFEVISGNLRRTLCDPKRTLDDPTTPRLHRQLLNAGEADVPCHLAIGRHRSHTGQHEEAMRLLDAVMMLASDSRDAWLVCEAIALAAGAPEVAARCASEAPAIGTAELPFGIPMRAASEA